MDNDDHLRDPLLPEVDRDVMQVFERLPEMLEAGAEKNGRPGSLPHEQFGEALRDVLYLAIRYLPPVAGRLDAAMRHIARLEARVGALEAAAA
jgi:hypothetical protein